MISHNTQKTTISTLKNPINSPAWLQKFPNWVCWRLEYRDGQEKPTKVPYNPSGYKASSTNPIQWTTYEKAYHAYMTGDYNGIGFMFSESEICGIDLDRCIDDNGNIADWAKEILDRFDSYIEYSPSGKGFHIYCESELDFNGRQGQVELYHTGRFFTFTGNALPGKPFDINNCEESIQWLADKYGIDKDKSIVSVATEYPSTYFTEYFHSTNKEFDSLDWPEEWNRDSQCVFLDWYITDSDFISSIHDEKFQTIYTYGDYRQIEPTWTHSEARMYIVSSLAFHLFQDNPNLMDDAFSERIDRLYRNSALYRMDGSGKHCMGYKWADRDDERQRLISNGIQSAREAWNKQEPYRVIGELLYCLPDNPSLVDDCKTAIEEIKESDPDSYAQYMGIVKRYSPQAVNMNEVKHEVKAVKEEKKQRAKAEYKMTDLGNAERLLDLYGDKIRYANKAWYAWNGRYWESNDSIVFQYAKETVRTITEEALRIEDKDERNEMLSFANRSENVNRIKAMIEAAKNDPAIQCKPTDFDSDPYLLNCHNGTVDLRNGELLPFNPHNFITRMLETDFNPSAKCSRWEAFLEQIFEGNQNKIGYLQRYLGYCVTGKTNERAMLVLNGGGTNGKTLITETMLRLLSSNDYAMTIPIDVLVTNGHKDEALYQAKYFGRRLVVSSEGERNAKWDESKFKRLTGCETIEGREHYKNPFSFVPTHKYLVTTNYLPGIRGTDKGIWSRLKILDIKFSCPEEEIDLYLLDKFIDELEGILAWVIRGAVEWCGNGLQEPEEVTSFVNEYRSELDFVQRFLDQCTRMDKGNWTSTADMYSAFLAWHGDNPPSLRGFNATLREKGLVYANTNSCPKWLDVSLIQPQY